MQINQPTIYLRISMYTCVQMQMNYGMKFDRIQIREFIRRFSITIIYFKHHFKCMTFQW